jgi:RNA polymerase sigma-70 factor, ECF subfamily
MKQWSSKPGEVLGELRAEIGRLVRGKVGRKSPGRAANLDQSAIVQEALLKAWVKIQGGCEVRDMGAWIRAISVNTLVDALRRDRSIPGPSLSEVEDRVADHRPSPSNQAIEEELRQSLAMAMARLAPQEREVLELRICQGKSRGETAGALRKSVYAVDRLVVRAIGNLRDELAELMGPG